MSMQPELRGSSCAWSLSAQRTSAAALCGYSLVGGAISAGGWRTEWRSCATVNSESFARRTSLSSSTNDASV